jgi:glycosyltransferase involved in cell wall biosynthesis
MHQLVESLSLGSAVVFLGSVADIPSLLAGTDVFVFPSLWEGLSLALVEAQASGLPVVASAVGGNPEVVRDGLNGLLVPPAKVDELVAAMLALGRDSDLRRRMGQAAREASQRFDIAATRTAYESLYREVLDGQLCETVVSRAK